VRIAYVVSRFPSTSETFVLRELNALQGRVGVEIELFVLFLQKVDSSIPRPSAGWAARTARTLQPRSPACSGGSRAARCEPSACSRRFSRDTDVIPGDWLARWSHAQLAVRTPARCAGCT
jgi:hypothetical protein